MSEFRITGGRGFHVTLSNGYTLSVQFGGGNYCANRDLDIGSEKHLPRLQSPNAEIAVWAEDGEMIHYPNRGDSVLGWVSPDAVAAVLALLHRTRSSRGLGARIERAIAKAPTP